MLLLIIKTLFFLNKSRPSLQLKYLNLHYGYIILFFFINSVVYGQTDATTKDDLRNKLESSFGDFNSFNIKKVNDEKVNDEITSNSQTDIIDVTTTGVGISKDEATKNALRNALESSFGAFISSKTEIVNDEIVNDEITSISTGNIVSYEIVSSLVEENNHFVTVNSQVSLVNFSNYIQSKGHNVTFNGNSFVMNMKLQKFNMESEEKVLNDVLEVFFQKFKSGIDFKINISEDITIAEPVMHTPFVLSLPMYDKDFEKAKQSKIFDFTKRQTSHIIKIKNNIEVYKVNAKITCSFNQNSIEAYKYLISSINSISMKPNEILSFEKANRNYYYFPINLFEEESVYEDFIRNKIRYNRQDLHLRSYNSIEKIISVLEKIEGIRFNFRIDFGDHTINFIRPKVNVDDYDWFKFWVKEDRYGWTHYWKLGYRPFLIYKNEVLIDCELSNVKLSKYNRSTNQIKEIYHSLDIYLSEKTISEIEEFKVVNLN